MSVPDAILNFPAAHCKQGPPLGPVDPALHVQSVTDVLPGTELEFGGHTEQLDAPLPYLPVLQAVHDASADPPVSTPYLPAPQAVHDASAVCPVATPYLPAPQAVHDDSSVCPVATPYLPAPQAVHDASVEVCPALYFPAAHSVQLKFVPDKPALQVQVVKPTATVHSR